MTLIELHGNFKKKLTLSLTYIDPYIYVYIICICNMYRYVCIDI